MSKYLWVSIEELDKYRGEIKRLQKELDTLREFKPHPGWYCRYGPQNLQDLQTWLETDNTPSFILIEPCPRKLYVSGAESDSTVSVNTKRFDRYLAVTHPHHYPRTVWRWVAKCRETQEEFHGSPKGEPIPTWATPYYVPIDT